MSRIGSSSASGVRVAAQPLSNVFTVLLLIGALALVLAMVVLVLVGNKRFGVTLGLTAEGETALKAPADSLQKAKSAADDLAKMREQISRFPEPYKRAGQPDQPAEAAPSEPAAPPPAVTPPAPAVETPAAPAPPAPAVETPAAPAPAAPAPAAPAAETPAAPAPAAATPPAPAAAPAPAAPAGS
jgi:outer membrane biosynthesis protein TonB